MAKKRYEVRGMMEWHPEFRVGRGRLQVSFTGGHLCGGAMTAASYETSDPVVQKVIESSSAYKNHRIRLAADIEVDPPKQQELSVMEFDDEVSAGDYLQRVKNIPSERVANAEKCMAEAKALGIKLVIKK